MRPRLKARLLLASAMTSLLVPISITATATPAQAAGCYGDYCSGKNPYQMGCVDSRTYVWGRAYMYRASDNRHVGNVELWISPTCGTRWARMEIWEFLNGGVTLQVKQSNGYTQTHYRVAAAGTYYTNMIYSRSMCSFAQVYGAVAASTGCAVW